MGRKIRLGACVCVGGCARRVNVLTCMFACEQACVHACMTDYTNDTTGFFDFAEVRWKHISFMVRPRILWL